MGLPITSLSELAMKLRPYMVDVASSVSNNSEVSSVARAVIAGAGLSGGGVLTADVTLSLNQGFAPTWTNLHTFEGGIISRGIEPQLTDAYDLGSSSKLWRKIWASELDAVLFAQNTITLLGGWLLISKNEGSFESNVAAANTTINFGQSMTPNDFVLCRAALKVEYLQVGTLVSGTTYNVTRNLDGSGANDWPAGTPYCVLGTTGDGRIELNAYNTPRIGIFTQGATYNASTEVVRVGDLNGSFGVVSGLYGMGIGDYSGGNYLKFDPSGGFVLKGSNGGISLDASGLLVTMPASSFDATKAVQFMYSGTQRAVLQTYFDSGSNSPWVQLKATAGSTYDSVAQMYVVNQDNDFASFVLKIKNATVLDVGYQQEFRVRGVSGTMTDLNVVGSLTVQNGDNAPNSNLIDGEVGALNLYLSDLNANITTPTGTNALRVGNKYGSLLFRRSANIHYASRPEDLITRLTHAYLWGPNKLISGTTYATEMGGSGMHLTVNNSGGSENTSVNFGQGHPVGTGIFNGSSSSYSRNISDLIVSTNVFFFGGWYNLTSVNRAHGLFSLGSTTQSSICWVDSSNYCYFRIYNATTNYSIGTSSGSLTTGWHFIGGWHRWFSTGDYHLKLFVDGTTYTYAGGAPTSGMRSPAGVIAFGMEYVAGGYLYGNISQCMFGYTSSYGDVAMQEYYYLTRPEYK